MQHYLSASQIRRQFSFCKGTHLDTRNCIGWQFKLLHFSVSSNITLDDQRSSAIGPLSLSKATITKATCLLAVYIVVLAQDVPKHSTDSPHNLVNKRILPTIAGSLCREKVPGQEWFTDRREEIKACFENLLIHLKIRSHCFIGEHPQGQAPISLVSPEKKGFHAKIYCFHF